VSRLPLGRKEDFHLEFKGRDALDEPEKIAREVVAFLNAKGGEVWVGLGEEDARAVKVEPIPDPERAQRRLLDSLIETVEPSPSGEEVRVEVVEEGEGEGAVLRVSIQPDERRGPYAFFRKGGRHFVVRIADRIRPMSREEIFSAQPTGGDERLQQALDRVLSERSKLQEERKEGFWLRLEPVEALDLDLQDRRFEEILRDPVRTGNRPQGLGFAHFQHRLIVMQNRLKSSSDEIFSVEIRRAGGLAFSGPLRSPYGKGDARTIWPQILCEPPVSALRVARALYDGLLAEKVEIVIDFALIGVEGRILLPGTPDSSTPSWVAMGLARVPLRPFDAADFLLDRPLVVPARDLFENPDAIGYRLVERVYEAFGLRRDQMPSFFDPVTRRLVLPS
jgi:Putative DNA-binding domain